jgi:ribosomal protein L37AE/L43A
VNANHSWVPRKRDGKLCDFCGERSAGWRDDAGMLSCNACRTHRFHSPSSTWVTLGEDGLWRDGAGLTGYSARMSGAWVCYSCGHLCDEDVHGYANDLGAI